MKQKITHVLTVSLFLLASCTNTTPTTTPSIYASENDNKNKLEETLASEDENRQPILNDISIETDGGVELNRAFLSYETDELVPASNITSIGKPVYLNLNITKGWKEEMGEVALGASEKISTDDGTVLLNESDLFQNYKSISAEDAKLIKLKAVVTRIAAPIKYFIVDYKVWDKNGRGIIKGSYKFFVE